MTSCRCASPAQLPGHPNIPQHLKSILRTMRLVTRSVPCTDGYRDTMRYQVQALQMWLGAPALFVTVNPADTKHPFTLRFASGHHWEGLTSALEPDTALHQILSRINLMHLVAADPIAVSNAFHKHICLFIEQILGCSCSDAIPHPDGLPSNGHGPFGAVSGYYGIVEPQLRGSLHLHLLLHLYGFTTAKALLQRFRDALPELTRRLVAWASSVASTSFEAIPRVLALPDPLSSLAALQPLPITASQRPLLQAQLGSTWDFAFHESVWYPAHQRPLLAQPPWFDPRPRELQSAPPFCPWPRSWFRTLPEPLPLCEWSRLLLFDLRHATLHCCLHECRARVCYKNNRKFCRLGFWHWRDVSQWSEPDTWQRCHGQQLQPIDTVDTSAPTLGRILLERHHPFHTRYNACTFPMHGHTF